MFYEYGPKAIISCNMLYGYIYIRHINEKLYP